MKRKNVIPSKYIPIKVNVTGYLASIIALDYWNAPQWLWGVVITVLLINLVDSIIVKISEKPMHYGWDDDLTKSIKPSDSDDKLKDKIKNKIDL